jgi:hypothetical protein
VDGSSGVSEGQAKLWVSGGRAQCYDSRGFEESGLYHFPGKRFS